MSSFKVPSTVVVPSKQADLISFPEVVDENVPFNVITKVALEYGDVLQDSEGNKIKIVGAEGLGTHLWTYKIFTAETVK